MPVVEIVCPRCKSEFVDSRSEWKSEEVARCPKCGTDIDVHAAEAAAVTVDGRSVHAEPIAATPPDRRR